MKKILLNAYTRLNFGDDLFLKILFDRYKDNNIKWVLPEAPKYYKEVFKEYKDKIIIKNNLIFKCLRKVGIDEKTRVYCKYDAGIYIGGSIFMESNNWKSYTKRRNKVVESFYKNQKPYFILGSNFGPYKKKEFINRNKKLFSKCSDVCFRDEYSYNLFKDLGQIRKAPDIVFQLKFEKSKKIKNSIGISLIDLENRKDIKIYEEKYINAIKDLIEAFIENNKNITLFSFCEEEGDMIIINKLIKSCEKRYMNNIRIENYKGNIEEFLSKFSAMENIVGTRFHSCILSQVFEQGIYPIIYSDKTYNVLKDIGINEEYIYIKDIENLDVKHVINVIANNKIKDINIFKDSEEQFKKLDDYIKKV